MKSAILLGLMLSTSFAFAGLEGSYRNIERVSGNCPDTLNIRREGSDLRISGYGNFTLNEKFNVKDYQDDLIITGINQGTEKDKTKNSSHGQTHVVKRTSVEKSNYLSIEIEDKESFGPIPVGEFKGTLIIKKNGSKLEIEMKTSYNEKMRSSNDWSKEDKCSFK